MINNFDYHNLEAQKYWSFPKSQGKDIRTEARNMIFSNNYIGARKIDGAFYKFVKNDDGTIEYYSYQFIDVPEIEMPI